MSSAPGRAHAASRTALVSIAAAMVLITVKLVAGLVSGSLALISEAVHSGSDLVAAILAYLALRVAGRPPDEDHPYGHGKAEHLSALMEGVILVVASGVIVIEAVKRLVGGHGVVTTSAWIYGTLVLVVCLDALRTVASWRASRRHRSAALAASAVHFASDLAGTAAVIVGLLLVDAGYPRADAVAAILVAAMVLAASVTLMRRNADILLDSADLPELERARAALGALAPTVEVRRLRLRSAAGRHFADAVIAVAPGAALSQAHAAADAVERVLERTLPGVDAVVHVEPGDGSLAERVRAAAQSVLHVREVHNVRLLTVDDALEASLHLKLPPETPLADARRVTTRITETVRAEAPEVARVHVHLEPLDEVAAAAVAEVGGPMETLVDAVRRAVSVTPSDVRLVPLPEGCVAYLTLVLPGTTTLSDAHALASRARRAGRACDDAIADVFVQTVAG